MYDRKIESIIKKTRKPGKVIILYGPRQVGKTTLVKKICDEYQGTYVTCDDPLVRDKLTNASGPSLRHYFGKSTTHIIIDEAQKVTTIGNTLKLLIDDNPNLFIIATGSSSFELSQKISEPLTGRKYEYMMYPLSLGELATKHSLPDLQGQMHDRVIMGMYPEIVTHHLERDLKNLASSYLFKDILEFQQLRNPDLLHTLLRALALQVGSEVSYNELANLLNVEKGTIERYIDLLEKAFVIFRLPSLHKNIRTELKKSKKIYFYDIGIRNAIINNLNDPTLRNDMGAIRENFAIIEMMKYHHYQDEDYHYHFRRTHHQKEIDLIAIQNGHYHTYECKRGKKKTSLPKVFVEAYPQHDYTILSPDTILSHTT